MTQILLPYLKPETQEEKLLRLYKEAPNQEPEIPETVLSQIWEEKQYELDIWQYINRFGGIKPWQRQYIKIVRKVNKYSGLRNVNWTILAESTYKRKKPFIKGMSK